MPVIAVINRKGGSGKSTIAAHLAAWLAHQGTAVMLGDIDRQQSARTWLRRRDPTLPLIMPWVIDKKNILKAPAGVTHVVLDTPGGLHGFELARVVMSTDVVIMPVCSSVFDRESAAACIAELMSLPKVVSGRCKIAIIGMRLDMRTNASETLARWALGLNVPFLGVLRETQLYVRCLEDGQTLFDMPASLAPIARTDLSQWETILKWLQPVVRVTNTPREVPADRPAASATTSLRSHLLRPSFTASRPPLRVVDRPIDRLNASRAANLAQTQDSLATGERLPAMSSARAAGITQAPFPRTDANPTQASSGALNLERNTRTNSVRPASDATGNIQAIPQFLLRRDGTANSEPSPVRVLP